MKRSKLLITFIFLLNSFISFSQENLVPGYIIKNDGEKVEGFIDYRKWDRSPHEIRFCKDKSFERKIYTPADIMEIGSDQVIFTSAHVEIELSSRLLDNLEFESKLNLKEVHVFLQVLFRGEKSLYYHKDREGRKHFYIFNNDKYELLKYKKYKKRFQRYETSTEFEGKIQAVENKIFIGQLKNYFDNCSTIEKKLEELKYDRIYFEKIFSEYYNKCNDKVAPDFKTSRDKVKFEYGILGGGISTTVNISSDQNYSEHLHPEFSKSNTIGGGIYVNMILPARQRKFSFQHELIYNSFNVSNHFEDITNEDYYKIYDNELRYNYLNLKNYFQVTFRKNKFIYFGKAGISNGIAVYEKNVSNIESKFFSDLVDETVPAIAKTRKHEFSMSAGLGFGYSRFFLEFRYESGTGMIPSRFINSKTNRIYGLLGIRLSK